MFEQFALLIGETVEAFLQKVHQRELWREVSPYRLLDEMVFEKFVLIFREALVTQGLFANEVKSDRPQPFPEIRSGFEIHDVPVGKDKGLVGDLVDEVGNRQFHRDEGTQMRAVEVEEPLKGGQIPPLHADDKLVFIYRFAHGEVYPLPGFS